MYLVKVSKDLLIFFYSEELLIFFYIEDIFTFSTAKIHFTTVKHCKTVLP